MKMKISKGIEAKDLALYLAAHKLLVIADVHIGYEEALNKQGVLVPRMQFKDIMLKLESVVHGLDFETVIILGDLKHEFGKISDQEWRETLKFLDFFRDKNVVLIKGNHDTVLGPIAEKRNVEVVDDYSVGDMLFMHGDKTPTEDKLKDVKTIIIGHEHPAVSIREGERSEKYKCYLVGSWEGKELIVMPSFITLTSGTDVSQEKLISPFLKQDLSSFEVFVISDKVYDFGKLKELE